MYSIPVLIKKEKIKVGGGVGVGGGKGGGAGGGEGGSGRGGWVERKGKQFTIIILFSPSSVQITSQQ